MPSEEWTCNECGEVVTMYAQAEYDGLCEECGGD